MKNLAKGTKHTANKSRVTHQKRSDCESLCQLKFHCPQIWHWMCQQRFLDSRADEKFFHEKRWKMFVICQFQAREKFSLLFRHLSRFDVDLCWNMCSPTLKALFGKSCSEKCLIIELETDFHFTDVSRFGCFQLTLVYSSSSFFSSIRGTNTTNETTQNKIIWPINLK